MRLVLLIMIAFLTLPAAAKARSDRYAVMTYNIRLDLASDGDNAWPHRRAALASLVAYYAPDVVGMQEVMLHQKQNLEADLPHYAFVGTGRDDGKEKGEFSPLGYRRDRFALRASGTFWLSPTPDMPGKGWDAAYPRIATWARLSDKKTKRALLVVNTHLDHVGAVARVESARQIRRWIFANRKPGEALILMGDLNSPIGSPAYAVITTGEAEALHDTLTTSRASHFGPLGTFNAFQIEQDEPSPIDHIFVGDGVTVLRHATLTQQAGGKLPSDHYPVLADLCLGKGC